MYTTALTLLGLAAAATSAPTASTSSYAWTVTNWSAGCARSGCFYDFNITGPACPSETPARPAFSAYCSGNLPYEGAQAFTPCTLLDEGDAAAARGVAAHLLPAEQGTGAHIEVSYRFTDVQAPEGPNGQGKPYYNLTGSAVSDYNQFVAPVRTFEIVPSSAVGIA